MPDPLLLIAVSVLGLACLLAGMAAWQTSQINRRHPAAGAMINIDGTTLHYRRTGPEHGTPLLILHGAASNLEEPYSALAGSLSDEPVIWLDRPGLGWSERPAGLWSPEREAGLIMRFLDALEVDEVIVLGHSWGGAIAMRTAIDHTDRVKGLILVAPALSAWIGEAAWFNKASFWPVLGPLLSRVIVPLTGGPQVRSGASKAFHPESVPDHYQARSALDLLLRPKTWTYNAADMRDVNTHLEAQEPHYATLDQPAIFLAGKADTVLWTHRHSGLVARRMPRGELRLIRGAGHNLHHHRQDEIVSALRDVRTQIGGLPKLVQKGGLSA